MSQVKVYSAIAGVLLLSAGARGDEQTTPADAPRSVGLTLGLVENRGQLPDDVRFFARSRGLTTFLTDAGLVAQVAAGLEDGAGRSASVWMHFEDASGVTPIAEEPRPGRVNFLRGDRPERWVTGARTFGGARYSGLYAGIDLVLRERAAGLEYDFELAAGADPTQIRVRCEGALGLAIAEDGALLVDTALGTLRQDRPETFRLGLDGQREAIDGRFVLLDADTFGFAVDGWDGDLPLVIDPTFSFTTFLGGNGSDLLSAVALGGDGSIYAAGQTLSVNFPTTAGSFDQTFNGFGVGADDAIVCKLSANGATLQYATFIGGTNGVAFLGEFACDIAVNDGGEAFVVGTTSATDFPTTAGALKTTLGGARDGFALRLNAAGAGLIYSTYLGGTNGDNAVGVAIDGAGNAYITGDTASNNFPLTSNAFDTSISGASPLDGFLSVLNPTGTALVYSTLFGAELDDLGVAVDVDAAGIAYVTGGTRSNEFLTTPGVLSQNAIDSQDVFALKVDPFGPATPSYSTVLGGSGVESGNDIVVDAQGRVLVTGGVRSSDFLVTPGAFDETFNGGTDAYVTKLTQSATGLLFSTYLGGSGTDPLFDEQGYGISLGIAGEPIVVGRTDSPNFPTFGSDVDTVFAGGSEGFVTRFTTNGAQIQLSSFVGGALADSVRDIALNGLDAVIVGQTSSTNLAVTAGVVQSTFGGGFSDAFLSGLEFGCAGGFTPFGTGCAGTGGAVPTLNGDGCPDPGGLVTLRIENGKPSSLAAIFFGIPGGPNLDLGGCFLQIGFLTGIVVVVPTNTAGAFIFTGSVPLNAAPGVVNLQALIADDQPLLGFSATNPMEMQVGDG